MMNITVFKYALYNGATKPVSAIVNSVGPLMLVIFADRISGAFGGDEVTMLIVFNLLAYIIMLGAFLMANSIQKDKMEGVLTRILAGPITLRSYLVQNFFAAMIPMTIISVIVGALGYILHDWDTTATIGVVIVYIVLSASSIGLSFVWSCLFSGSEGGKEASLSGISVLLTLSGLLGGLMLPLAILPTVAYYAGTLFPAHWAARSIEQLILYGEFTNMYWLGILAVAMFTVAFLLFGSKRRMV